MDFIKHIFSRGLPKTGQSVEYVAGDDGTYEAGWWLKRLNANNRTRFVTKTIGGDVVVYDRATGLCWVGDNASAGGNSNISINWPTAIAYANGLDFAGFTDWRIPNAFELFSLVNVELYSPSICEPPFINTGSTGHWSSTSYFYADTKAWTVKFTSGTFIITDKTPSTARIKCVRKGI